MVQPPSKEHFPLFNSVALVPEILLPENLKQLREVETGDVLEWEAFCAPLTGQLPTITPLESRGNRPLEFSFYNQIYSLVYFHAEEYSSGRAILEDINDPKQSPPEGLPQNGIGRGTFFEALHSRGLEQMFAVFERLSSKAAKAIDTRHEKLGNICALDGSLIDATLSMEWADYTDKTNKAKVHLCFDLNHSIPSKIDLTEGKGPERPMADKQLEAGQTGVMDRGYQDHRRFDCWTESGKYFVCRIKGNTQKTIVQKLEIPPRSKIIFFAEVYLGDEQHRTRNTVRLVGFNAGRKVFWVVTNRQDINATEIAFIYRLRWEIEKFFAWWKKHLNVYHLIARSPYGLMMQLLSGLITYLLLVIYFYWRYSESPSLLRLRQLRRDIRRERALSSFATHIISNRIIMLFFMNERRGNWKTQTVIIAIF